MSTLGQFAGGGIKSIQRGTISVLCTAGTNSATATITSIDTSKSEVSLLGASGATSGSYAGFIRVELTNATTVTAYYVGAGVSGSISIGYQVVERY